MEKLHNKKFITFFLVMALLVVIAVCRFLTWHEMRIKRIDLSAIPNITGTEGVNLHLNNSFYEDDIIEGIKITIEGWFVIEGRETNLVSIHVLLKNNLTGDVYVLPTSMFKNKKVTEHFADGINYDDSGFAISFATDKFDFVNTPYELLILYENEDGIYQVDSGRTITVKKESD